MSVAETRISPFSSKSLTIKPPSHPTYDLKGVIKLALAEDAGDRGLRTCSPFSFYALIKIDYSNIYSDFCITIVFFFLNVMY